jgi:hypothetical protein
MVLRSDEQGGKAIGEHTCAIKPNIPMRSSTRTHRPRVGITRGTLNMIMLAFGFVREEHTKTKARAWNAPYRRNQYTLGREEGEDVERVCPLSDCAEERVCGNDGMSERTRTAKFQFQTHSCRSLLGRQRARRYGREMRRISATRKQKHG